MACRELCLLLLLACLPAGSFVLLPAQHLTKVNRRGAAAELCASIFNNEYAHGHHGHGLSMEAMVGASPLKRRYIYRGSWTDGRPQSAGVLALGSQRASRAGRLAGQEELQAFASNDGVSYLQNGDTGSEIWLVGVIHGKVASVELIESAIREIKPQVVVLELDADRLDDLPPGRSVKTEDGLCWFTPDEQPDEMASAAAAKGGADGGLLDSLESKKKPFSFVSGPAAKLFMGAVDALINVVVGEEGVSEMGSAVREAQACGARVLLGDRDFEETKRQLVAAGLADNVDDERLDDPEALLNNSMSPAGKRVFASLGLRKPETRETAREYYAALKSTCNTRALSAMIPERDEVMARNLMALEGKQVTVALVGIFHVDGIENILADNGWQFRQSQVLE